MNERLDRYCALVIAGTGLSKGQTLVINAPVECAAIARVLAQKAWEAGAGNVYVNWGDDALARMKYINAGTDTLGVFESWEADRLDALSKNNACFLSLSAGDPEALKGVDPEKIMVRQRAAAAATKAYKARMMSNENQWCVFSVPTESWAKKVFPGDAPENAAAKLWDAIITCSRADGQNPAADWKAHGQTLKDHCAVMNGHNFAELRYTNSLGTDLRIGLPKGHIWRGGEELCKNGAYFSPNIPTEEIFTAPDRARVNGVIYSTKPLVYQGDLIDGFALWFEGGRVVKAQARKNEKLLNALLTSFPNADRLGEVALVPFDSPISQSGILFYNTLYDENASCHLAFGMAYPDTVAGTGGKADAELEAMGLNVCDTHNDFMVGSRDLSIIGVKENGEEVTVFENGNFAF